MRFLFLLNTLLFTVLLFPQDPNYQALDLDKALTENANAVVRLDQMKIDLTAVDKMSYSVKLVVTVLNKKGNRFATSRIGYDEERKIKDLNVYVFDKLGNEAEHIKKKDFQDLSAADGFSLYTDDRLLYNRYTPTDYPYTVALYYTIETSDTAFFPPWYFLSGYLTSLEKSHYSISYSSPDLKPEIKEFNLEDISVSKSDNVGKIVYETANIPAIKYESLSPPIRDILPRLAVRLKKFNLKGEKGEVNSWSDFGTWMSAALLRDRAKLDEATIAKANELVAGVSDNLEKAKIIYKYVQDNTRYISVQIGIGGWKPISAIDVDRVKYGDCKGLSNYTHALLNAVDVPSFYTVIHAGRQKVDFDADFPALQGNHAILAVPYKDQYYWIDCTSQVHPFGFVGDFTDDRNALVVTPEGGKIVRTISYHNEQNYQHTKAHIALDREGGISADVNIDTKGIQYDDHFGLEEKTKEDVIKYYKEYWDNINNLQIKRYDFGNDRENIIFTEKIDFGASNYASISGDRMLFAINVLNRNGDIPKRYRNRKLPFSIARGFLDEDEFEVAIPEGYGVEAIPNEKFIENEFGVYKAKFEHNEAERKIKYNRSFLLKRGDYSKEKYSAYRNFRKEISGADNAQVVLIKN